MAVSGRIFTMADTNTETTSKLFSDLAGLMGVGARSDGRIYLADLGAATNNFAKFKHQNSNTKVNAWPTEADRKNNNWGMSAMPKCISFTELWDKASSALKFPTLRAPWRIRDFDGYFHAAPKNIIHQMVGSKLVANAVFPDDVTIPFYILQRSGLLAQKGLGTNQTGIDTSTTLGLNSSELAASITTEDLSWDGETLYGNTAYSLGIVVFNEDGSVAQRIGGSLDKNAVYKCSAPLSIPTSQYNMNMYILQPALNLAKGSYYAVAAAIYAPLVQMGQEQTYQFLPLQSATGFPNKFPLSVSGAEAFQVTKVTVNNSTSTNITTTASSVTVAVTIKNNSGKRLEYANTHIADYVNKWVMNCGITGSVTTATSTTTINTSRSSAYNSIFSIAAGGTTTLSFVVQNIWSNSATTSPTQIKSGKVTLNINMAFNGESLDDEFSHLITINYGL